jgi:hypothetical protein
MNDFYNYYSRNLGPLISRFEKKGFELILVGGVVRDYLLDKKFSKDIDIEVCWGDETLSADVVFATITSELNYIGAEKIEVLAFNIVRFCLGENDVEISIGRIEKYIDNDLSHKNFLPTYIAGADFDKKWQRRDLRINAIGFNMNSSILVDPFDGVMDIKNKVLRNINNDFYLDPVRLLRLIRFKLKLGFSIDPQIDISRFQMSKITFFHLFREGEKVGLSKFFQHLSELDVLFSQANLVLFDFAKKFEFQNFREMVYNCAKSDNNDVYHVLKDSGLFSLKKYKKIKNYFILECPLKKERLREEIKLIGNDFYKWIERDC